MRVVEVVNFDRKAAALGINDGRIPKVPGELGRVDGGRHDVDPQALARLQDDFELRHDDIRIDIALMGLINDDAPILAPRSGHQTFPPTAPPPCRMPTRVLSKCSSVRQAL